MSKILSFNLLVKILRKGLIISAVIIFIPASCKKIEPRAPGTESLPPDVAIGWIKMQQKLFVGTPGLLPHVTGRVYAYLGLTLYESLVPGMAGYQSIAPQLNGNLVLPSISHGEKYYWPASVNAASASILRNLLPHAPENLKQSIDSLEAVYYTAFDQVTETEVLKQSVAYGRQIANAIFEWSKTDGGHEAYKKVFSENYLPPSGRGQWVSTGEFPFTQPVYPHWGENRTFIRGLAAATQPGPPPPYSEQQGSAFYNAVSEIYEMSQNLSRSDSLTAKFWAYELLSGTEVPEYEDVSHAANIATQLIKLNRLSLQDAVILYCKHSIAGNEAAVSCVKTKFHYNLVRPITYIRTVLGHNDWRPLIHTPPFPEYTSAHAAVSMACATILEAKFGKNFSFTDYSFKNTYGSRSFESFEAYAQDAAISRLQAGIHYRFSMVEGLKQGKKISDMVNQITFKP